MLNNKDECIFLAGHNGMVGKSVKDKLVILELDKQKLSDQKADAAFQKEEQPKLSDQKADAAFQKEEQQILAKKQAIIAEKKSDIDSELTSQEMMVENEREMALVAFLQKLEDEKSAAAASTIKYQIRLKNEDLLQSFILINEKIDKYYSNIVEEKQRSQELREILIITEYLKDFESIPLIFDDFNKDNVELSYLNSLVEKNVRVLNSRLELLIQNESDWQAKSKISKFLDLNTWKVLELRNTYAVRYITPDRTLGVGSMIDPFLTFTGFYDGLIYLPRAIQVAFLSPFPSHWMETGATTGRIGRIISGFEMIIMYLIYIGFLYAAILKFAVIKRLIPVMALSVTVFILIGYTLPNIGTIFRFRIDFIMPIFMVGAFGISLIINKFNKKNNKYVI